MIEISNKKTVRDITRIIRDGIPASMDDQVATVVDKILAYLEDNNDREASFFELADDFANRLHIGNDDLLSYFSTQPNMGDTSIGWRVAEYSRWELNAATLGAREAYAARVYLSPEEVTLVETFLDLVPRVTCENNLGLGYFLEPGPGGSLRDEIAAFHKAIVAWRAIQERQD